MAEPTVLLRLLRLTLVPYVNGTAVTLQLAIEAVRLAVSGSMFSLDAVCGMHLVLSWGLCRGCALSCTRLQHFLTPCMH
jgi:hypothetical protein